MTLEQILKANPQLNADGDDVRQAIQSLKALRDAGLRSEPTLVNPGGRRSLAELKDAETKRFRFMKKAS